MTGPGRDAPAGAQPEPVIITPEQAQQIKRDQRITNLETAIQQIATTTQNIIQYLDASPQQSQPTPAAGPVQPQQGKPALDPSMLPMLLQLAGGGQEDPFVVAMKQKAIQGMDLTNQLTIAMIKRITEGKAI